VDKLRLFPALRRVRDVADQGQPVVRAIGMLEQRGPFVGVVLVQIADCVESHLDGAYTMAVCCSRAWPWKLAHESTSALLRKSRNRLQSWSSSITHDERLRQRQTDATPWSR
jgi:hypothetical protein